MRRLLANVLVLLWMRRLKGRLAVCRIGDGSRLWPWRIAPSTDGRLVVGQESNLSARIVYERPGASVSVGSRTFIGAGVIAAADSVTIGDDVLISWGVNIVDHDSHAVAFSRRARDAVEWLNGRKDWSHVKVAPVVIGSKSWIGMNAIILRGVVVGEGAVVGAGAVVTKSVPPWTIVAGNPARVVRELPPDAR